MAIQSLKMERWKEVLIKLPLVPHYADNHEQRHLSATNCQPDHDSDGTPTHDTIEIKQYKGSARRRGKARFESQ